MSLVFDQLFQQSKHEQALMVMLILSCVQDWQLAVFKKCLFCHFWSLCMSGFLLELSLQGYKFFTVTPAFSFSRYRLIEVRFRIKPVHLDVGRTLTCQFPSTKTASSWGWLTLVHNLLAQTIPHWEFPVMPACKRILLQLSKFMCIFNVVLGCLNYRKKIAIILVWILLFKQISLALLSPPFES